MARTNPKPLTIVVLDPVIRESEAIKKFIEKGHKIERNIITYGEEDDGGLYEIDIPYDVVIGPQCWRIDPSLRLGDDVSNEESLERQLEMMEKGIRAIKYPKKKGEEDAKATK